MINTESSSDRCVICGKFLKYSDHYAKLCPKHQEIEQLIVRANNAIFDAEQSLYRLEKAPLCRPLYRMRCNLGEVKQAFRDGRKVCDYIPTLELVGRLH